MKSETSFDLIVLGAGPGGMEAAILAAQNGQRVALISNQKPGGRATWGSLVPSKVWLTAAESADTLKNSSFHAIGNFQPHLDLERLRSRIVAQGESASIRYREQLVGAGVELLTGKGVLVDPHTVTLTSEQEPPVLLQADAIVIAAGSEPSFREGVRPVPPRIFAPRHTASLAEMPASLLIVGGGVTGVEYAYAFAALGTRVTILHHGQQLLPRMDERTVTVLEQILQQRYAVTVRKNDAVSALQLAENAVVARTEKGQTYRADYAFLATGRRADTSFFDPQHLQFDLTPDQALLVDPETCQTQYQHIYAVGDVTGGVMTANHATLQARAAVSHLLQLPASPKANLPVVEMAYTHPAIGQVGDMERDKDSLFLERSFSSLLKAHLEGNTTGLVRLKVDTVKGMIRGAAAVGPHAAELLNFIQLAMNQGIPYHKLRSIPLAHPSFGELLTAL
ncbi:MAG: NAD(P)/FAD-dependent oxidoreductase [Bacteroidetes bacterium]|nr:MAG: NAD(P)/FAD-dependent oxidoreductase [Bacteroidota bacterium]